MARNKTGPRLTRVTDSRKLAELTATLQHYERESADAQQALAAAQQALEAAEVENELAERRVLAGKATDSQLAAVQARLMEAKHAHAVQATRAEDTAKVVKHLPYAIEVAKQDARAEVAATLRERYAPAVERLRAALLAAKEASDEVTAVFDQAYSEFTAWDIHPRYHSGAIDLGDAGLTTTAAGLVALGWPELTPPDRHNKTRLELWLAEADALLAKLPTMAEADIQSKQRAEEFLVWYAAEEEKKLARLALVEKRNAERFMGIMLKDAV